MTYIPKDNWVICQRTGIKFRRSEMRKEWNGLWVHRSVWEPRHPQDFVRVDPENPTASLVFPQKSKQFAYTTLIGTVTKGTNKIAITVEIEEGATVGIVLNNGAEQWTFVESITENGGYPLIDADGLIIKDSLGNIIFTSDPTTAYDITIATRLFDDVDGGNVIDLPSINNEDWT